MQAKLKADIIKKLATAGIRTRESTDPMIQDTPSVKRVFVLENPNDLGKALEVLGIPGQTIDNIYANIEAYTAEHRERWKAAKERLGLDKNRQWGEGKA